MNCDESTTQLPNSPKGIMNQLNKTLFCIKQMKCKSRKLMWLNKISKIKRKFAGITQEFGSVETIC